MPPDNSASPSGEMSAEDAMAAEWAAALAEASPAASPATEMQTQTEQVAPASFANFAPTTGSTAGNDINMILDIPVQLTVELGRTRIPIKHILQLAQGSVVELEPMAGAGTGQVMRSIASLPISPSQRLVTVEVGTGAERRWLVLGVTAQNISTLHTMAPQDEALATSATAAAPTPFAQLLGKFRQDKGSTGER